MDLYKIPESFDLKEFLELWLALPEVGAFLLLYSGLWFDCGLVVIFAGGDKI